MNNFDKITESPETLAEFLEELSCVDTPWDNAFYRAFCDNCTAENCEGEECQHAEQQDKAYWWLMQEAGTRRNSRSIRRCFPTAYVQRTAADEDAQTGQAAPPADGTRTRTNAERRSR